MMMLGTLHMANRAACSALANLSALLAATGKVGSLPLRARGQLLEHRSPAVAGTDSWAANAVGAGGGTPNSAKGRIVLHHVRDWVVDHTQPAPAIWLVTTAAWYRWALLLCFLADTLATLDTGRVAGGGAERTQLDGC
jgi:hypothetical protein